MRLILTMCFKEEIANRCLRKKTMRSYCVKLLRTYVSKKYLSHYLKFYPK
jgi:hypothetical protein